MPEESARFKPKIPCQYISLSTDRRTCDILSVYVTDRILLFFILVGFLPNLEALKKTYRPNDDLGIYTLAKVKTTGSSHNKYSNGKMTFLTGITGIKKYEDSQTCALSS